MMERTAETSPRLKARIAGVLYLIIIVTAGFAEIFVRGRLVVRDAAAATATNILAHESLYRLGGSSTLVCDTALALLFYELLKPVSRSLALLAAFFRLMHVATLTVSILFHFAALIFLTGTHDLSVFSAAQLQEQALLCLIKCNPGWVNLNRNFTVLLKRHWWNYKKLAARGLALNELLCCAVYESSLP